MKCLFWCAAVAGVVLAVAPSVQANPIAVCQGEASGTVTSQTVQLQFDVDPNAGQLPATIEVYRDVATASSVDPKSPTAVLVATLTTADGKASKADMGSGVSDTVQFSLAEECVPVGSWKWDIVANSYALGCYTSGDISAEEAACAGTGAAGGAAAGGSGGSTSAPPVTPTGDSGGGGCSLASGNDAVALGLLSLAVGLGLVRRRRS